METIQTIFTWAACGICGAIIVQLISDWMNLKNPFT